jgi:phosphoglycolate phosphatase
VNRGWFGEQGVLGHMGRTGPVGFDLDMTLIDSRPAIMAAWQAVAEETGAHIDLADVDLRMGIKLEDEVAYWFPAAEHERAAACYRRHYVALAPTLTTLLPGAAEALAAVKGAGEDAVIVTAKHAMSVEPSLRAVGLAPDRLFTHVHGAEKGEVLARLGAAAYVGDTPADMGAARLAAALAVGVPTGSFDAGQLVGAGADIVLGSLLEFPSWYARLRAGPQGARRGVTPASQPSARGWAGATMTEGTCADGD